MTTFDDFKQFVADEEAGAYYQKWASQNPGELSRWKSFRDSILAGYTPAKPPMITKFGAGLVDAGVMYLDSLVKPPTPTTPAPKITLSGLPLVGKVLTGTITYA